MWYNNTSSPEEEDHSSPQKWSPQLTKIVATIGPTSEQLPVLQQVVRAGMSVMRLNFSHATVEEVELRVGNLAQCRGRHSSSETNNTPNVRATLLDTRGPEIRTGKLQNDDSGHSTIHMEAGQSIALRTDAAWAEQGSTAQNLFIDYPSLHKSLVPGMRVLLDDGAVILTVTAIEGDSVICHIDNSGELRSRAGVNLPGAETDLPAMSEKDKVDIKYGMTKDVDYVAASFIQSAEGVHEIRNYMTQCAEELGWDLAVQPLPLIISKIESVAALNNYNEILEASDGIMVARGDLGVEIPIQQVTNAQKEMVASCNAAGKPVIVATQMLESMAKNPRPTRAEVADVTNAVYDGADAVMLSGETAKGKYPVDTIKMMNEIICSAEQFQLSGSLASPGAPSRYQGNNSREAAIAKAAVTAVEERQAAAILVLTSGGTMARMVSANRPNVPIVTFCPNAKVARQLIVSRGIHPIVGLSETLPEDRPATAIQQAKNMGFVQTGDEVVVVTMEVNEDLGNFATMKIASIP